MKALKQLMQEYKDSEVYFVHIGNLCIVRSNAFSVAATLEYYKTIPNISNLRYKIYYKQQLLEHGKLCTNSITNRTCN